MKNLIVYYSYEGNTEELVKGMREVINADTLRLTVKDEKPAKSMFRFVWGGLQVYMKKKLELEPYHVSLDEYDNIIIGTPCWFGSYAPAIHTFLSDNKISGKNIYLFVCNGGNMRNTWHNFEMALKGNTIVSKIDLVYPIKNGIDEAKKKVNEWIAEAIG